MRKKEAVKADNSDGKDRGKSEANAQQEKTGIWGRIRSIFK